MLPKPSFRRMPESSDLWASEAPWTPAPDQVRGDGSMSMLQAHDKIGQTNERKPL